MIKDLLTFALVQGTISIQFAKVLSGIEWRNLIDGFRKPGYSIRSGKVKLGIAQSHASCAVGIRNLCADFCRVPNKHWILAAAVLGMLIVFAVLTARVWNHRGGKIKNRLEQIEANSPA